MPDSNEINVSFGPKTNPADVTPFSMEVVKDILRAAGLTSALVSSTARKPNQQARVMYDNLEAHGVAAQKQLYAAAGDAVIDVYANSKAAGKSPDQIKKDMETKIIELGPTRVSHHAADPSVLNVFDVAPSSINNKHAFETAVKNENRVSKFLIPPNDPGYHLEIPQPSAEVNSTDG
jgi:hypothetical protein